MTMAYFTNFQDYLFLCSDLSSEEKQKLDCQRACKVAGFQAPGDKPKSFPSR